MAPEAYPTYNGVFNHIHVSVGGATAHPPYSGFVSASNNGAVLPLILSFFIFSSFIYGQLMKIRIFQLEVTPGRPRLNTEKMLAAIAQAKHEGISIIVFPEMAIPGYLLGDEWEREAFVHECEQCGKEILATSKGITVIFGNVAVDRRKYNEDGRSRKYNACFVAENGQFLRQPKTRLPYFIKFLMPNYREFDDNRHFYDPRKLAFELNLQWTDMIEPALSQWGKLGCLICEDGWDQDYNISPVRTLDDKGADLFINISSSPYTFFKNHKRYCVFSEHARRHAKPLIYANATGLQDNGKTLYTFDGASCVFNTQGQLISEIAPYQERHLDYVPNTHYASAPVDFTALHDDIENQYSAILYGTKIFLQRAGIDKIVIGVSGGIDSALIAAIYRQIMPPENLLLVNMPGPFSSTTTRGLAASLAEKLGIPYAEIPITESVELTQHQLETSKFNSNNRTFTLNVSDFVLENIQARDRSSRVLAGVAAAFGGAFTCNANKSEMTVGYSTLYGDLGGCLASIADLWKTEVYKMANWVNTHVYGDTVIPQGTIDIVPSAELSAQQNVDAGEGDPLHYPYHDRLFQSWVERWQRATPEDNLRWYLDGTLADELGFSGDLTALFPSTAAFIADLERWWNLYQGMAIAKRIQAPPVLAVKRRAFGFDHRESQLGPRYSARYQELKREVLAKDH